MPALKPGSRLKSQVDDTQLIVVRAPAEDLDIRVGGHPVIEMTADPAAGLDLVPGGEDAVLLGKRYASESGDLELLVTKAGAGALTLGDAPIAIKDSKPLPSSD